MTAVQSVAEAPAISQICKAPILRTVIRAGIFSASQQTFTLHIYGMN